MRQFEWFQIKHEATRIVSRKIIDMKMSTRHMPGQSWLQADLLLAFLSYLIVLTTREEFLFPFCIRGIWGSHRLCHLPKAAILQGTEPGLQATPLGSQNKWWAFNSAPMSPPRHVLHVYPCSQIDALGNTGFCQQKENLGVQSLCFSSLWCLMGTTVQ